MVSARDVKLPAAIAGASFIFFIPFVARFFTGDDWLWLGEGLRVFDEPAALLQRNIYGYLRPLALGLMSVWVRLAGGQALLYGVISAALHALNVFLLYRTMQMYGASKLFSGIASFLFAFYYLNAPAVAWIAATPDLMATAFALLLLLQMRRYTDKPTVVGFILAVVLAFAALLTKESGIVCLGLFFGAIYLSPATRDNKAGWTHAVIICVLFAGYMAYYFATRTFVDKEIGIGWSTAVNLWYFLAYSLFPLSERMAALVPESFHSLLLAGRILSVILVPVIVVAVLIRGDWPARLFLFWTVLFTGTITLFAWDVSLTSLFPERTAARYMYSVNAGASVVAAWLLIAVWRRLSRRESFPKSLLYIVGAVYIVGNLGVIYKVTEKYRADQIASREMFDTIVLAVSGSHGDCIHIVVPDSDNAPQVLSTNGFVSGMAGIGTGREVKVVITDGVRSVQNANCSDPVTLLWDESIEKLVIPPSKLPPDSTSTENQ